MPDSDQNSGAGLTARNLVAWDKLYASTPELVWGRAAAGFLPEFVTETCGDARRFRHALDAATGEGRNLAFLTTRAEAVTGCDGSAEALAKFSANESPAIQLVCAALDRLPFADDSFDFILLCDTVETLPDPVPVLRELRRVAAPGARLVCNIPPPEGDVAGEDMAPAGEDGFFYQDRYYYRFFEAAAAAALLKRGGWRVLQEREMEWVEPAHPGFRAHDHTHRSNVFLAEPDSGEVESGTTAHD
ncbi:class I SAM-dependent methyltransferase [Synoicihabitans lomoniglobus]|uniref:Class I SAM-dependent methyltransferase n=1 Tax=Synoicihabitans lomoniglobus TaxID=2909285 RepID=A0AAF0A1E1_9BACT|nr:class I SAM-dependent methyltransferase [Opitutaceae bacterium LMO-M01]WED65698.1 class I SAM-dependent methyltransferase [Opitutaceae bacterium LMO-M01]